MAGRPLIRGSIWGKIPAMGQRCRAFTLIQFTITVLVMLAAIGLVVPALRNQIARARSTHCQFNLSLIHRALAMYVSANDQWWPERQVVTQAGLIKDENVWIDLLLEDAYIGEPDRFICPSDINAPLPADHTTESFRRAVAYAPSYGLNELTWREYGVAPSDDPGLRRVPVDTHKTILLADRGPDYPISDLPSQGSTRRQVLELARDAGRLPADDDFRLGVAQPPRNWLTGRHRRSINLMTMMGSKEYTQPTGRLAGRPPEPYYDDCATENCTFCNVFKAAHYDFSSKGLFFWTGPYYAPDTAAMLPGP